MAASSADAMQVDSDAKESSYASSDSENISAGSSSEYEQAGPSKTHRRGASDEQDDEAVQEGQEAIEGDFDRLVTSINDARGITDQGALNKIWETTVREEVDDGADQDIDFRDELRKATGIGKRKGVRRPRRTQPALSQQVKSLLGDAVSANVDRDLEREISILQEVIKIEPKHAQAWDMLSDAYQELNDPDGALLFKIMAAHLRHDPDVWMDLGIKSKERGHLQQALYCYKKATQLDPNNVDALWDRALLAKDINDVKGAKAAFLAILDKFPHDLGVILELQLIIVQLGDISLGIALFEGAMAHYMRAFPTGNTTSHLGEDMPGGGFGETAVCTLADFCTEARDYEKAIRVLRTGIRWLQGRQDQRFWNALPDDREYDVEGASAQRPDAGTAPGHHPLTANARHRLAIARLKLGDLEEGKAHAKIILENDVVECSILFREIADAFFEQRLFEDALQVYEKLATDVNTSSLDVVLQIGACNRQLGNMKEAAEVYEHLLSDVPDLKEAKFKLAEVYEQMGDYRKALDLMYQVIDARKRIPTDKTGEHDAAAGADGQSGSLTLFEERPKKSKSKAKATARLDPAQLEEVAKRKQNAVDEAWRRLKELTPRVHERDPEAETQWLVEAEILTDAYRETRDLFTTTNKPDVMTWRQRKKPQTEDTESLENDLAARLQLEIDGNKGRKGKIFDPDKDVAYRGILFDDWLTLYLEYAFLLTRRGQYPLAEDILKHASYSRPFADVASQDTIRLGLIACAICEQKYETVVEICRKFVNIYQFQSDTYNLITAALASGHMQADAFQDARLQKHLSREVRLNHEIVTRDEGKFAVRNGRYTLALGGGDKDKDKDDMPEATLANTMPKPVTENAGAWAVFGQSFLPAKSYQTATFYMMHAFEVQPHDPVICLTLAITCLGRAMQRQADNRHYMIVQAMTFMTKYKTLRGDAHREECNYNMGRAFHQLCLFTEALQLYEKVLASVEKRRELDAQADLGLARETAYNMAIIYNQTGAIPLAQDLYRKWLTI